MPTLRNKATLFKSHNINKRLRSDIYNTVQWRNLRYNYICKNPLCEICLDLGVTTPAEDVHHKKSFERYTGSLRYQTAFDYNNLMSLCKRHHALIHKGHIQPDGFSFDLFYRDNPQELQIKLKP